MFSTNRRAGARDSGVIEGDVYCGDVYCGDVNCGDVNNGNGIVGCHDRIPIRQLFFHILLFSLSLFLISCSGTEEGGDDVSDVDHEIYSITELSADEAPNGNNITSLKINSSLGEQIVLAESNGLLVRFKSSSTTFSKQDSFARAGVKSFSTLSLVNGLVYTQLQQGQSLEQAIQSLAADPSVIYVEPNYIYSTQVIPDDPRFGSQWALHNNGQNGSTADADIDAPEAWEINTGNDVVIAVIDTGVDYNHPDLVGNIWTNPNEIAGNRVDDDGNGFVDDVRGWDFASNDNNPMDENDHGTHVSGIIAARGNNGVGVSGVNWNARIMPLKFMNAAGQGTTAAAIRAVQYAISNGARISNSSWGGPGFSRSLRDAISAGNAAQHVFVAAAGNDGVNIDNSPTYPASYNLPNVIAVAATNSANALAGFSNYGANTVDVAAPGVTILSTIRFSNYRTLSGTSMAAPFVAGLAGLIRSVSPTMSASNVISVINSTVDPLPVLRTRTVSGGRINAFNALSSLTAAPNPPPVPVNVSVSTTSNNVTVGDSIQITASGGVAPYTFAVSNPSLASINNSGLLTALAVGNVTVTATDSGSNQGTSSSITISAATPPPPPPLVVSPISVNLGVGQTRQFSVSGGVSPYNWSTSNGAIATIGTSSGLLTGQSPGMVVVTVTDGNGTSANTGAVTIVSLSITPADGILPVGDSATLTVSGGAAPYQWSSSNGAVLSVNSIGVVNAISSGFAVISVTDANGISTSSGQFEVRSVSITPSTVNLLIGDTLQLSASGGAAPYQWSINYPSVASISANGMLTALSIGSVRVFVQDADGFGTMSGNISVTDGTTLISITPNTANVNWSRWQLFTPSGGVPPYTFSLSNPAAGIIYTDTWPGWFRATGAIGSTTTVIVTDANGDTAESGTVTVQ